MAIFEKGSSETHESTNVIQPFGSRVPRVFCASHKREDDLIARNSTD